MRESGNSYCPIAPLPHLPHLPYCPICLTAQSAMLRRLIWPALLLSTACVSTTMSSGTSSSATSQAIAARPSTAASECFPFERLPAALRPRAEELLLKALDSEALYTIASDIKPMSSGFVSMQVEVAAPDVADAEAVRQILATWTCGDRLVARLHHFSAVYDGKRPLEGVVFNTRAMRAVIGARQRFFAPYGITPSADPTEALLAIEYDQTSARLRGYGYFFGYPDYAVDFFARAADDEKATKQFTAREFVSLPTVSGERRFVYAVEKAHQHNDADRALAARVNVVYQDYVARRKKHVGARSPSGVLTLVREWLAMPK